MGTRFKARPLALTAVLVLLLGAVSTLLYIALRPVARPPIGAPPSTSAAPGTTTVNTTTTATTMASRATTTISSPQPFPNSLRGTDITRLPGDSKVVALTFDVGGNTTALPTILRTLTAEHVRATFFITGDFARHDADDLQAILAAGQRIGNLSMTYPHMPLLSDDEIAADVQQAQRELMRVGADPRPLFRFPYGESDIRTIAAVNAQGYIAVRWTVDTLGWRGTSGGATARSVTERVIESLQPGEIVLMHTETHPSDGSALDAEALPDMITRLRARGYGFATPDVVLGT